MPLKTGATRATQSYNIKEMLSAYDKTGKIGNTKPRNKSHARQIAIAASYKQRAEAKRQGRNRVSNIRKNARKKAKKLTE